MITLRMPGLRCSCCLNAFSLPQSVEAAITNLYLSVIYAPSGPKVSSVLYGIKHPVITPLVPISLLTTILQQSRLQYLSPGRDSSLRPVRSKLLLARKQKWEAVVLLSFFICSSTIFIISGVPVYLSHSGDVIHPQAIYQ